ncbi:MAG TPA: GntR family transcriptional regulator [Pseudomonas sp.]|uniref:GntR family transcriptional regulator n=1 Tax=Pseudomonas sp. TaxID=306 RepID=UPI002B459DC5|nr:GntR family transcriptional regulator [Pseudomonas sp.]HKS15570.1 GntR family transcriptional regulator [Pseudomonas sp.]
MLDTNSPFLSTPHRDVEPKADFALKRLRHALLSCELRPGEEHSEAQIAERFALGRAAVRMSLTTLAAEGLIAAHARRGWRVTPVSGAAIGELIQARRALEPVLAQVRLNPEEKQQAESLSQMIEALGGREDRQSLMTARSAERQLLELLAAKRGGLLQRWLLDAWNQAARIVNFFDQVQVHYQPDSRHALLSALASGDETAARTALFDNIEHYQRHITDCLLSTSANLASDSSPATPRQRRQAQGTGKARPAVGHSKQQGAQQKE